MAKPKDQTMTCLAGKTVKKSATILEVLGDLDELNCLLGLAKVFASKKNLNSRLALFQADLFQLGGWLAGAGGPPKLTGRTRELEKEIEKLRDPGLRSFVKPGDSKPAAFLHLARAVCRRAERKLVSCDPDWLAPKPIVEYLNQLSGVLFWLAVKEDEKTAS